MLEVTLLIIICIFENSSSRKLIDDVDYNNQCLRNLILEAFTNQSVTIITGNFTDEVIIPSTDFYLYNLDELVMVSLYNTFTYNNPLKQTNVIAYLDYYDLEIFTNLFDEIDKHIKILIVLNSSIDLIDPLEINKLFKIAWDFGVIHLNIVAHNQQNSLSIFSLNHEKLCEDFIIEEDPNYCVAKPQVLRKMMYPVLLTFPSEKCKLNLASVIGPPFVYDFHRNPNPGIMVSLIKLTSWKMKTPLKIIDYNSKFIHEFLNNGSFFNLLDSISRRQVDVAIGHLMINYTQGDVQGDIVDFGPVIFKDYFILVFPKQKKLKSYRKLAKVFELDVWNKVLQAMLIGFVIYYLIGKILDERHTSFLRVAMDMVALTICAGINRAPQRNSLRILLVAYTLLFINIDAVYLGKLSSIFSSPDLDQKVISPAQIRAKQYRLHFSFYSERLTYLRYSASLDRMHSDRRMYVGNKTEPEYMNQVAETQDNCTLTLVSSLDVAPTTRLIIFYWYATNVFQSMMVTPYISKKSPFNEALLFWSTEINEKGFNVKWFNDLNSTNFNYSIIEPVEPTVNILTVSHFQELFIVLSVGYGVAFVGLGLEYVFKWADGRFNITEHFYMLIGLLKPPDKVWKTKNDPFNDISAPM